MQHQQCRPALGGFLAGGQVQQADQLFFAHPEADRFLVQQRHGPQSGRWRGKRKEGRRCRRVAIEQFSKLREQEKGTLARSIFRPAHLISLALLCFAALQVGRKRFAHFCQML
ncbi:hypothetical protein EJ104_06810 [Deinococcus radiophilus]|uniref:Uncharacterized protein n=1 Tax=Deinococcus radiophilus TaxID=32062 RepID=A0A3S0L550_9DEIO|nr:hypothetical protein EJ104_06810 [Deinococcus radiophilus]